MSDVPLREYIENLMRDRDRLRDDIFTERDRRYDQRFQAQQEGVRLALEAMHNATEKAEANAELWRCANNEWRGAMNDRERAMMPRNEIEQCVLGLRQGMEQQIESLHREISNISRLCIGAVMVGIAVVTVILLIWRK